MHSYDVIETFRNFYRDRGHRPVPDGTLLRPPGDPVLFTTSGMHPLTPYLEGRRHPLGRRLVNVQRCLRTTDLDEVGDPWHLTVFQMLGSWSLGDYDGSQSLRWGYQLLRDEFGVDVSRLHVTVFGGDDQVGPDRESWQTWTELGLPVEPTPEDNWWSNGPTGPCGPDSELFYWTGDGPPTGTPSTDSRWVEIWNHVMMRYRRLDDGSLMPLSSPSVDTGMGLERLLTVLQQTGSVFDCDVFDGWVEEVDRLWRLSDRDRRVVIDHLRSCVVVLGDGVRPSSSRQGYVLRRLVRRVLTTLWRDDRSRRLGDLPPDPVEETSRRFGQPDEPQRLLSLLDEEERRFRGVLDRGQVLLSRRGSGPVVEGEYRYWHETHGLPRELVDLVLGERLGGSQVQQGPQVSGSR
ncbi:MAG: hypothetical protein QOE01_131 [Actinomycetota bacterium]|jgi:alanyl-tRNA synthetase|nr:hypothetical protein [Actinomycetota bacterium]